MDNEIKNKNLKTYLTELEKDELISIIIELLKIDVKNKEFLNIYLKSSDEINFDDIIKEAKLKIYRFIYGRSIHSKKQLQLREAKKVISDCNKILKNHLHHIADLKLYYVETCNEFTQEFGDIDEAFYNSVLSTFNNFCDFIYKNQNYYNKFSIRIKELYKKSRNIGWGYSDDISEMILNLLKIEDYNEIFSEIK